MSPRRAACFNTEHVCWCACSSAVPLGGGQVILASPRPLSPALVKSYVVLHTMQGWVGFAASCQCGVTNGPVAAV